MSARSETETKVAARTGRMLPGLDGKNPLGFLAALGLLHVLHSSTPDLDLRMGWTTSGGTWVPVLEPRSGPSLTEEGLLTMLNQPLSRSIEEHPARLLSELGEVSDDP